MTLKSNQIILSGMKKEQSSVAPEYNNYSWFHYQKIVKYERKLASSNYG